MPRSQSTKYGILTDYSHSKLLYARFSSKYYEATSFDACFLWFGAISCGYGKLEYNRSAYCAHVLAYFFKWGVLPQYSQGQIICHKCNVKRCVNPYHLYLGTDVSNARDYQASK